MIGTARGVTHNARNIPNQDSAGFQAVGPVAGTVVAVADGHGHDRHFRSATGSRLAVRSACQVITELATELAGRPWQADVAGHLRDQLPEAIVAEWRAAVSADIAAHPYGPDELAALEAAADGPEIPYGSTLLVALIAEGWLICAQIGDGDLVAVAPDGGAWSPVAGDDLLDGHRTTSLCQPEAVFSFRTAAHNLQGEPLLALLLGTDGYGNSQARDPWQPGVARDIADLAARHDHGWFAQQLPGWAERCASTAGSGDDTTIALLMAPGSQRLAATARPLASTSVTGPHVSIVPPAGPIPQGERTVGRVPEGDRTSPPSSSPPPPAMPPPGPGSHRHAAPSGRNSRRRAVVGGIAAVAVVGAVVGAVMATRSPGAGQPAKPPHSTAPARVSTSASTGGNAPVKHEATPTSTRTPGQPGGNSAPTVTPQSSAATPSVTANSHSTQNQEG